ncbi:MAG: SDR family oxidoreductase [Candidatus Binatia bacterium]|nr:SDR family oxidoreductase [Candidatus Binatia bacterium]
MAAKPASKRQKALVTGASAGIGAAFAARLARDSFDLILVARDQKRLEARAKELKQEHGVEVDVLPADLTKPAQCAQVEKAARGLDLLVNNAGFGTFGSFWKLDIEREEEEIRLNVVALVRLTHAALPSMVERGQGAIINVSSLASFQPMPFNATYGATKAYVTSFTEALAEELRGTGVKVQALCPGFTRTEFQQRAGLHVSRLPAFLWMSPEEVVDASLAALRQGQVVVVPGAPYKAMALLTGITPRLLTRRIAGVVGRTQFAR